MRLALLIALAPDRRSGRVLSDLMPADQALAKVKQAIITDDCPDADFPILQAVAVDAKLREHRFTLTPAQIAVFRAKADLKPETLTRDDLIIVELGEGEDKVVINVTTDEEASFLKMLSKSMADAGVMIESRRVRIEELGGEVAKLEALLTSANGQITQLEADLQRETAYKAEVNQRIATLEADLKAAQEKLNAPATTGAAQGDLLTQPPSTPAKKKSP